MPDSAACSRDSHKDDWQLPASAHGVITLLILGVTAANLWYFYVRGLSNLYGDGLAHMEGARRIFDSITPGYQEIGSVWLPLYHLICAPLTINDFLWRSGLAGGLVSSAAFALTCYLLFRLGAELNRNVAAGLIAVAGAVCCPSFLYLASTPLTEPLAIMWCVLVVYALFRYSQAGSWKWLSAVALAAFLGSLTRYEGWNLLPFAAAAIFLIDRHPWRQRLIRAAFFALIAGSGPLLWLIHNAHRYHNPLEFYNGPGSAEDIYAHQLATTAFPYPTDGSLVLSSRYYLEDLKLVLGSAALALAVLGLVAWCASLRVSRRASVAVLLLVPLPFYVQAMAHAAIPLYVPTLFPFGHYNIRYGVEMIAAAALFPTFVLSPRLNSKLRLGLLLLFLGILGAQFFQMVRTGPEELPIVVEGIHNNPCRSQRQRAIIAYLRQHYDGQRILMAAGNWPCIMPTLGVPFRNTITSHNRWYWRKMRTEPGKWVEWIVRGDGDPINNLMQAYPQAFQGFEVVDQGTFLREGSFEIYRRR